MHNNALRNAARGMSANILASSNEPDVEPKEKPVFKKAFLPGDDVIIKIDDTTVSDDTGIRVDAIVSELTQMYKAALQGETENPKKFFDAVLSALSNISGAPVPFLKDPDNFALVLSKFEKNVKKLNEITHSSPVKSVVSQADLREDAGTVKVPKERVFGFNTDARLEPSGSEVFSQDSSHGGL
jgi:hypothetical protein